MGDIPLYDTYDAARVRVFKLAQPEADGAAFVAVMFAGQLDAWMGAFSALPPIRLEGLDGRPLPAPVSPSGLAFGIHVTDGLLYAYYTADLAAILQNVGSIIRNNKQ